MTERTAEAPSGPRVGATLSRRVRWQEAEVLTVVPITPRASRITLRPPDWPGHRPGQHLDVRLTAPDGYTAQRSYSIASPPETTQVEIIVETLPDGEVSPYLTGELRTGDALEIRGPIGGWFVWHAGLGGPLLLVAGGSGVVPFLAMLGHHRASGSDAGVRLLYSTRTLEDAIAADWLRGLKPPVQALLTLTRAAPSGWTGLRGRLDRDLLCEHAPPDGDPLVMVCGPTAFVEAVSRTLIALGHRPERMKTERFGAVGGAS